MKFPFIALAMIIASFHGAAAQGNISYDYYGESNLKNNDGDREGRGSMSRVDARLTYPLSMKQNNNGFPTLWALSLNASYASLDNDAGAKRYNPNEMLNTGLTLSHIRPLSGKWNLIAAVGCGIYSEPNHVRWQSVLANAMAVAAYRFNETLSMGAGGGLTNSFGVPMVLPMVYLDWRLTGKYELTINFMGRLNITGSMWVAPKWKLAITPIEMDGMSAVIDMDGRTRIYSATMMKALLTGSYYIDKRLSVYGGVGCVYRRTARISKRNIGEGYKSMFSSSGKHSFATAFRLSVGVRYGF